MRLARRALRGLRRRRARARQLGQVGVENLDQRSAALDEAPQDLHHGDRADDAGRGEPQLHPVSARVEAAGEVVNGRLHVGAGLCQFRLDLLGCALRRHLVKPFFRDARSSLSRPATASVGGRCILIRCAPRPAAIPARMSRTTPTISAASQAGSASAMPSTAAAMSVPRARKAATAMTAPPAPKDLAERVASALASSSSVRTRVETCSDSWPRSAPIDGRRPAPVSYTHLTLSTIYSV